MIFYQNVSKTGSSNLKGQKGQIQFLLKFDKKSLQLIKAKSIFFKIAFVKKFFDQNSKAKAKCPPVTMKAGLQGQTFFSPFLINMTQRFLK